MARNELFDDLRSYRPPLSDEQRRDAIDHLVRQAKLGAKYCYTLREACAILHASYDEMNTMTRFYQLDVVTFRDAYRVPWWALAEYLIEPDDDLDGAIDEFLRSRYRQSGQSADSRSDRPA